MIKTADEAIYALAERSHDNRQQIRQQNLQRRNEVTDLYGVVFHRDSKVVDNSELTNKQNEARFYISISKDLVYYERFQFKLNIENYSGTMTENSFEIFIDDVNVTPYLIEQHGGDWIDEGNGFYPKGGMQLEDDVEDFYDILDIASVMMEVDDAQKTKLLGSEFKKVQIVADRPFTVDAYIYVKFMVANQ